MPSLNRLAVVMIISFSGCTSSYKKFYRPVDNKGTVNVQTSVVENPIILSSTGNPEKDIGSLFFKGLGIIGDSVFNGEQESIKGAIKQAKEVGATHIVVAKRYSRTISGTMPITVPDNNNSYSSGNVSVYGSGGYATGTYSGTTTTYGTKTTYVPYSVDRYDQLALFFAPLEKKGYGVILSELTNEQKQMIGSNKGVSVWAVREGSPAYKVDIIPGDIIQSINGVSIGGVKDLPWGVPAKINIWRSGKVLEKTIIVTAEGKWP